MWRELHILQMSTRAGHRLSLPGCADRICSDPCCTSKHQACHTDSHADAPAVLQQYYCQGQDLNSLTKGTFDSQSQMQQLTVSLSSLNCDLSKYAQARQIDTQHPKMSAWLSLLR